MKEVSKQFVSLPQRLSLYGVEKADVGLNDLVVKPSHETVLALDGARRQKNVITLHPKSVHDLKRWLGVPNDAVSQPCAGTGRSETPALSRAGPVFIAQPPIDKKNPEMRTNLFCFLMRDSSGATKLEVSALNKYLKDGKIAVSVFFFQDIYVFAKSRLIIGEKVQALFARHVYVEAGGVIDFQGPLARLDCAGVKRLSRIEISKFAGGLAALKAVA